MQSSVVKVFCAVLACLSLLFALPINALANDSLGNGSTYYGKGTFERISDDQVPEHITPLEFENDAEKEAYFAKYYNNVHQNNKIDTNIVEPMATYGDYLVDYQSVGWGLSKINLYVNYSTSGDGNTGIILHADPYTSHTGGTISTEWNENVVGGYITSSGKDFYAYANGELITYLVVNGLLEIYRSPVNLSGYAYLVR